MRETPPQSKKMVVKNRRPESMQDGSRAFLRAVLRKPRTVPTEPDHPWVSSPYDEQFCSEYWLG